MTMAGEMLLNGDGQLTVDWGAMGEDGEYEGGDGDDGSVKAMSRSGSRNSLSAMSSGRSPAPSVGRGGGGARGGGSAAASMEALNEHVMSLEEENVSLRALTRSLMNERHELLSSLDTSANEVNHLRRVCNALQSKLQSAGACRLPSACVACVALVWCVACKPQLSSLHAVYALGIHMWCMPSVALVRER